MARSEDWNQLNSSDFVRRSRFHFIKIGSCAVMVTLQHLHRFDRYLQLARQVDLPHRLKSIKPVHREQKRDALGEVGRSAEKRLLVAATFGASGTRSDSDSCRRPFDRIWRVSLTNHVAADPKMKIAVSAADVLRCKLRMYLWASLPGEQHAMAVILALIVLLVISAPAGLCQSNARAVREKSMNTTSTSSPAGYRHAAAAESTLSAAQHTRMRTFTIGLLLPEIRSADVPWLFQTQQAFLMAVRNFNRNLLGADVPWRIRGQLFDEDLLIEHMATQSSMWQNVTSSERSNHTTASCTGTVNVGKRQWSPEYQGCQVLRDNRYSGLLNALDLLQRNDCIAVVAVQSDQLVRVVAPLASPLSVPVVTTNVNRRLHSSYYGSLLRASINDTNLHKAASDIMDALGWHKAVAIYSINNDSSEDPIFSLRMVKITHLIMPASNGCALPNSTKTALNNISRSDVRVIIMYLDTCYYPVILEYAKHIGLIAGEKRFVWIFMDLFNGVRLLPRRFWPWLKGTLILRPSAKSVHMHSDRLALTRFAQMLSNLSVTLDDKKLAGSPALCPSQDISEVSLHAAYVHDIVNTVGQALSSFLADLAADDLDSVLIRKQRSDSRTGVLNLQELCNGTDLLAGIDNASHSSIKENVFAAFDHEYKLEIVSDEEAHTRYLSHWSPSSLSLHREINESRLLEAWDGVLPLPVHLDTVRVIVLPDEPFIFPRNKTSTPTDLDDFIGPVADLWKNVSCLYGMKYNISVWARGENGTNQLLQSKCREKIASWDLVLGAISARPRKKQRCSFSQPYYYDHMAVVILKPPDSSLSLGSVWGIFKPFGLYLWLTLVATLFFGAAALVILDPEGLQTARRGNILLDATFFAFSSLLGFGEHNIQQLFGKVFIFCLQFMLCVILASYTASLTNMLSGGTPEGSVRTLEDLTRKTIGYSIGSDSGDWIVDLFETKNKWLVRLEDLKQAEKKLMDRTIDVYFTHSPRAKLMQARNCKLMAVPIRKLRKHFSLMYNSDWVGAGIFKHHLKRISSEGSIHLALRQMLLNTTCRPWVSRDKDKPLSVPGTGVLFAIAGVASVISLLFKSYYYLSPGRKKRVHEVRWKQSLSTVQLHRVSTLETADGRGPQWDTPYSNMLELST